MLKPCGGIAIVTWALLSTTAFAQSATAKFDRLIALKGMPHTRVPVVTALAIHPDGKLLATAGDDHLIRLWDMRSGRLVNQLKGHRDWITAVAFGSDGSELITGSRDRQVLIWDVASGKQRGTLGTFEHPISSIRVGPEERVAVVGFRAPLQLFHLAERKRERVVKCPCSDTRAVAFSSDLRLLAAGGRNGLVRVWNLSNADSFDFQALDRRVRSILFVPGQMKTVVAGEEAEIRVWDLSSRQLAHRIPNPCKVLSMTMISDSDFAVAGSDNTIRLYRVDGTQPHTILKGHTGSIAALTAHDGKLISGSFDTTVRIWDIVDRAGPTPASALSTRVIPTAAQ